MNLFRKWYDNKKARSTYCKYMYREVGREGGRGGREVGREGGRGGREVGRDGGREGE